MDENKLVEFLEKHKDNPDNWDENGNYDPNPYWLAEEIINLFSQPE